MIAHGVTSCVAHHSISPTNSDSHSTGIALEYSAKWSKCYLDSFGLNACYQITD